MSVFPSSAVNANAEQPVNPYYSKEVEQSAKDIRIHSVVKPIMAALCCSSVAAGVALALTWTFVPIANVVGILTVVAALIVAIVAGALWIYSVTKHNVAEERRKKAFTAVFNDVNNKFSHQKLEFFKKYGSHCERLEIPKNLHGATEHGGTVKLSVYLDWLQTDRLLDKEFRKNIGPLISSLNTETNRSKLVSYEFMTAFKSKAEEYLRAMKEYNEWSTLPPPSLDKKRPALLFPGPVEDEEILKSLASSETKIVERRIKSCKSRADHEKKELDTLVEQLNNEDAERQKNEYWTPERVADIIRTCPNLKYVHVGEWGAHEVVRAACREQRGIGPWSQDWFWEKYLPGLPA